MTTYRERRLAKAERLRGWSESNAAKAAGEHASAESRASVIPFGQPILVGHHSEGRDRRYRAGISRSFERSFELSDRAAGQAERANSIEAQAEHAIYSDDEDAVERLEARIAELKAERDRYKAYNASCKRGEPDVSVLDEKQRANVETIRRVCAYQLGKKGEIGYTNLSANIRRNEQRLEQVKREKAARESGVRSGGRVMLSRFESTCADCGETIEKGTTIVYYRSTREAIHRECPNGGES